MADAKIKNPTIVGGAAFAGDHLEDHFIALPYPLNGAYVESPFDLHLKNATSAQDLFRGLRPLETDGSVVTVTFDKPITSVSAMLRDCYFETVRIRGDTSHISNFTDFARSTFVKNVDCVFDMSSAGSPHANLFNSNIVEMRFVPNTFGTVGAGQTWSLTNATNISDNTLVSIANALSETNTGSISGMGTKYTQAYALHGTSTPAGSYHIFTLTGITSDMTLLDFITDVKGWTAAQ